MTSKYVRGSSPQATRNVIHNILDVMREANVTTIHRDTLQAIVDECDRTLAEWRGE